MMSITHNSEGQRPARPGCQQANDSSPLAATAVSLRPIQPDDVDGILAMHRRVSADSLRLRFLGGAPPSRAEISRLSRLDPAEGQAIVAVQSGDKPQIIGLAYYLVDPARPDTAEPAFLVEDRFQGQCIGAGMMALLRRRAISQGIRFFDAVVEGGNRPMLRLLHHSGSPAASKIAYGAYEITIELTATLS